MAQSVYKKRKKCITLCAHICGHNYGLGAPNRKDTLEHYNGPKVREAIYTKMFGE